MLKKQTADDDSESQKRTDVQSPEVCVDYLSYTFDEMDLAASWRVMTKQKKDIANGIRLENASWRTWAKQRNHLKTITPETLNWLKDSDVTWLYGPLHTVTKSKQNDRYSPKESSAHDKLGLIQVSNPATLKKDTGVTGTISTPMMVTRVPSNVIPSTQSGTPYDQQQQQRQQQPPLKSALKKVTMSDILRRSASEFHVNDLDRDSNHNDNSCDPPSESSFSLSEANRQLGVFSPAVIATHRQPKLRFNQRVEQYIVISDDDGSSTNGSVPKVRMTSHLDIQYDNDDDNDDDASSDAIITSGDNDQHYRRCSINGSDVNGKANCTMDETTFHKPAQRNRNEYYDQYSSHDYLNDSDDDRAFIMNPHQTIRRNGQQKNETSSSCVAPRSIRRIEPAVLKSSSYSDTSRRGSLSSWDDDDHDRQSIHLPDYYAALESGSNSTDSNNNINGVAQSIQWEGQPTMVYDVVPTSPEIEADFMDDDDWEIRQQSSDSGSCMSDKETDHINDHSNENNNNSNIDLDGLDNSNIGNSKMPVLLKNLQKPNPATLVPPASILSPGKASKSQPISEPSPIDALQHHHQQSVCSNTFDIPPSSSASCHEIIFDQQQQFQQHPVSSVFGNISQWASAYLRKS